jgi:DNA helicase-2/ATP-dependent DNA helicase PcrA
MAGSGFGGGGSAWGGNFSRAEKPYPSSGGGHFGYKPAATPAFNAGPALEPKSGRGTDIAVGKKVFHAKFGEGKVLTVEGAGADARAQINFPRHGVKWLALSVAKLTPVDD